MIIDLAKTVPSADCTDGTNLAKGEEGWVVGMIIDLAKTVPTFFGMNLARRGEVARAGMEIAVAKIVPTFLARILRGEAW